MCMDIHPGPNVQLKRVKAPSETLEPKDCVLDGSDCGHPGCPRSTEYDNESIAIQIPWCPKCEGRRGGKFCPICGTVLVEGIIGCECGYSNIWPHEDYCQECGKPVIRKARG